MSVRTRLKHGDVFYLKVGENKKYVFGRMLFDVKRQYHKLVDVNNMPNDILHSLNYLRMTFENCQLVEMYEGIYDNIEDFDLQNPKVLVPRIFTRQIDGSWNLLDWGKIGNIKVDYTKIEFPEQMRIGLPKQKICRGELAFLTTIGNTEMEEKNYDYKSLVSGTGLLVSICVCLQGRMDLSTLESKTIDYSDNFLKDKDLLYNPEFRTRIYTELGLDPNKSYYELSKELGFDLARFYEK
ncbi:hypothetical protein ACI76W_03915 [Capnocytophaga canimorsus]|uniref:hypothetical protein n=1 Tax=Capnocytophaga canimorsus TaxID=28188 RepID=UPI00385BCCFD